MKELSRAKSRLAVGKHRSRLALAFARDTVAAVSACPRVSGVLVVTNDPFVRLSLAGPKVRFHDDLGSELNSSIFGGLAHLQATAPGRCAVMVSDIPSATTESVTELLIAADEQPFSFVADDEMHGTTAVFFRDPPANRLLFGPRSRHAYLACGATELTGANGISRDVDRVDHLSAAIRMGVGTHTRAALSSTPMKEMVKHVH